MLQWKLPHSIERVSTMPALILTSVAAWLACTAWMRPLSVPDEVRYTDVARWMAQHGDWLAFVWRWQGRVRRVRNVRYAKG